MKTVKIFWHETCPKCPQAKDLGKILEKKGFVVEKHNIKDADGMAEALFFNIFSTPSIIVLDEKNEIASWRGSAPKIEEIEKYL